MGQATAIGTEPLTSDDWEIIVSFLPSFLKKLADQSLRKYMHHM